MYNKVSLSIVFAIIKFKIIFSNYLEVESHYVRPLLEHNNVVNKGLWIKNKAFHDKAEKLEDFIFRSNSLDVENLQQGYDVFSENNAQISPLGNGYMDRFRRAAKFDEKGRSRKSLKNCTSKNCITDNGLENPLLQPKLLTKLKPASVFNDYPFEIAVLLDNTKKEIEIAKNISAAIDREAQDNNITAKMVNNINDNYTVKIETLGKSEDAFKDIYNVTNNVNNNIPKRSSMPTMLVKKNELIEELNITEELIGAAKIDRDVFAKDDAVWHQNAPIMDVNRFKVMPKVEEDKRSKPVTERGLLKVLSMLTKTFKKIMKQHDDIKEIHKKMHNMNKDFMKTVDSLTDKFNDFDKKYLFLMKFNERLQDLEEELRNKERIFKTKEIELSKNLIEFENQQKKFLTQQRQFYNIQKLMLAQNEKISAKQNLISKTQSDISHRQNNFARILKKAKQIYVNKFQPNTKVTYAYRQDENNTDAEVTHTTTNSPISTDSIKINLFSIPAVSRIQNQDHLLLNEKDDQPVDDLVYKYYFNNTFIDTLMKSKILGSFLSNGENADNPNVKNKRNELTEMHTTLLLPVTKPNIMAQIMSHSLNRKRRWINHHSQRKSRRRNRGKGKAETPTSDDMKQTVNPQESSDKNGLPAGISDVDLTKNNPFLIMATNFCNGIGQNNNKQVLDWCVEKALRRLQNIDVRIPPPSTTPVIKKKHHHKPQRKPNAIDRTENEYKKTEYLNIEPPQQPLPAPVVQQLVQPLEANRQKDITRRNEILQQIQAVKQEQAARIAARQNEMVRQVEEVRQELALRDIADRVDQTAKKPSIVVKPLIPLEIAIPSPSPSEAIPNERIESVQQVLEQSQRIPVGQTNPIESTTTSGAYEATIPVSITTVEFLPSQYTMSTSTIWSPPNQNLNMFFPDNDQLESNLKKYELKPDTEGNVYFDGSLHASDMIFDNNSDDGFSDIMQLESNSRIQVDPATFDLQAKRRAYLRKMNEMATLPENKRRL